MLNKRHLFTFNFRQQKVSSGPTENPAKISLARSLEQNESVTLDESVDTFDEKSESQRDQMGRISPFGRNFNEKKWVG
jgi:hypothetical protein